MKLIIDIPEDALKEMKTKEFISIESLDTAIECIQNGIPLDDVKAEIKEKCDSINDIVSGELSYPQHRGIQELLCEILDNIDKVESEK